MRRTIQKGFFLLMLLSYATFAYAQQTISGKITDAANGEPLVGVTIMVKGTTVGTTTAEDGTFRLEVPGVNSTLTIRMIGYVEREFPLNNQTVVHISIAADDSQLSEVVVTALGIERSERSLGYATQEVKGDKLTFSKEQNVLGSLSGKIAGVQVVGASGGSMGGTQKIKIRGYNSISGTDQPLIVVDGTPISNANFTGAANGDLAAHNGPDLGNAAQDINPDDVESVNVLKGPAATALYGLRGQYGVIMITTKKGQYNQKTQVDFSSAFAIDKVSNFMPMQNVYGTTLGNVVINGVNTPYVTNNDESWGEKMDGRLVRHRNSWYPLDPEFGQMAPFVPHPDNIKDFYEIGRTFNNNISFYGGGETATFKLSYNNTDIKGTTPNSYLKRNNLSFNGSLKVSDKITLNTSLNYGNNNGQRPDQGYTHSGSNYFTQWFQRNLDMKKQKNYKYADGRYLQWNGGSNPTAATVESLSFLDAKPYDWNNPYFNAYENPTNDKRDRFFGNASMSYAPVNDLKLIGTIRGDMFTQNIESRKALGGWDVNEFFIGKYQNREMNYEFLAQYSKKINDFSIFANGGLNLYDRRYDYITQRTSGGLLSPDFFNIEGSVDRPITLNFLDRKKIFSAFLTSTFGYKDLIYLDASIRRDVSSTLPTNNNANIYPSVSTSFIFSDLLQWKPLSYGKLRLGIARAGSDIPTQIISNPFAIDINGSLTSAYLPNTLNNPNLKPSYADSFESGLEMRFLDNRLGFDLAYYVQQNKNQAIRLDVSGTTGYTQAVVNAGNIENKGVELSINANPVRKDLFNWDVTFNMSRNVSKVKELIPEFDINNRILASNTYSGVSVYLNARVGGAYGMIVGRGYQRDPATGKIFLGDDNLPLYEDNKDLGSIVPDFTGGFTNNFTIWKFDVTAMIDFQFGGKFVSWSRMLATKSGQHEQTAAMNQNGANVRDPLEEGGGVFINGISKETGEEVSTFVDARSYYRNSIGTHAYEEWAYDASFVKLREARIGYTFTIPPSKTPIKSINVGIYARNPWMIWQKAPKGLDPSELSAGDGFSWLETGQLNTVRQFGVNLNVKF